MESDRPHHEVPVDADGLPADVSAQDPEVDDLDERLAAALERAGHLTRTMIARQSYLEGVSALQFQLLLHLGSASRTATRVSDLATELDVSQATVSDALSAMRRKALVTKDQDPADRRSSVFVLTAAGRDLCERLARWDRPLTSRMGALDASGKGTALRVVLELLAGLHDDGVINVARTCLTCHWFAEVGDGADEPYRCNLLGVGFGEQHLRVDCAEHEPAGAVDPD